MNLALQTIGFPFSLKSLTRYVCSSLRILPCRHLACALFTVSGTERYTQPWWASDTHKMYPHLASVLSGVEEQTLLATTAGLYSFLGKQGKRTTTARSHNAFHLREPILKKVVSQIQAKGGCVFNVGKITTTKAKADIQCGIGIQPQACAQESYSRSGFEG
jgi:hypothetical protein